MTAPLSVPHRAVSEAAERKVIAEINRRMQQLLEEADRKTEVTIRRFFFQGRTKMIRTVDRCSGQGMSRAALLQDLFSLDPSFWNHPSMRSETPEERKFRVYRERIEQAGQLRLPFCKEFLL